MHVHISMSGVVRPNMLLLDRTVDAAKQSGQLYGLHSLHLLLQTMNAQPPPESVSLILIYNQGMRDTHTTLANTVL